MFIQNGREAMVASKNVSALQSWKYFITLRCMELHRGVELQGTWQKI